MGCYTSTLVSIHSNDHVHTSTLPRIFRTITFIRSHVHFPYFACFEYSFFQSYPSSTFLHFNMTKRLPVRKGAKRKVTSTPLPSQSNHSTATAPLLSPKKTKKSHKYPPERSRKITGAIGWRYSEYPYTTSSYKEGCSC